MPENTPNLELYLKNPVTDGNDTFNIETMLNQNFRKIDEKVATKQELSTANKVKNLGFRGLLADPVEGIGGPDHINKYPEGLSAMYTDRSDWAVFLNMTDFSSATEFLFVETNKTIQDGKINAAQEITRYKKETTATPVKLIERHYRVWYSDASYTGWSNAEKVASAAALTTHLAEKATLNTYGHTKLSNATDSESEELVPTLKALKATYDKAKNAETSANGASKTSAGMYEEVGVNIATKSLYIKRIPLLGNPKRGLLRGKRNTLTFYISFNTNRAQSLGYSFNGTTTIGVGFDDAKSGAGLVGLSGSAYFGSGNSINGVWIDVATNELVIEFYNSGATTSTLNFTTLDGTGNTGIVWEAS